MGVKLNSSTEPDSYRQNIDRSAELVFQRYLNPFYFNDWIFSMSRIYRDLNKCTCSLRDFSGFVINQRRHAFRKQRKMSAPQDESKQINSNNMYMN